MTGALRYWLFLCVAASTAAACAPARPTGRDPSSASPQTSGSQPSRTLVAVVRVEPSSVAQRALREAGVALYLSRRMFNGELAIVDPQGAPQLYLAEALPELNTPSWQVFPDGRMQTTYRLKPNLTWHDGHPLSAEDFVFSWRVYSTPQLGVAFTPPFSSIEEALAPDDRTLILRWRRPYPDAATFTARSREFPPLPRHVLEEALQPDQLEAFPIHPFWTREYLGLGPYRLDRWEPGAFIDAVAFGGHALGRAKIERIKLIFMPDANTALANILSGEVQLSADTSLRLEQAATLRADWGPRRAGTVLEHANQWRASNFQLRPDFAIPKANLDARVRKALGHAVDKQAINDALYQGQGIHADHIVSPTSAWGPAVENSVIKYPLDPRATERLMADAGFTKGADGFYTSPSEGRYVSEAKTDAAADNVAETSILAAGWRQAGFDVQEAILPVALAQDGESRSTFSGVFTNNTNNGEAAVVSLTIAGIPSPANRWIGGNRGGWVNADYDRLVQGFNMTLEPSERAQQMGQMARTFTEEMPSISLFFRTQPWAFVAAVRGPQVVVPEANMAWNIHEWEFQ